MDALPLNGRLLYFGEGFNTWMPLLVEFSSLASSKFGFDPSTLLQNDIQPLDLG